MSGKTGRNDPCPCGSGRKYKHCHARAAKRAPADDLERVKGLMRSYDQIA